MTAVQGTPTREVAAADWHDALAAALAEGYDFFDFLTAVDQTDVEEQPGFDLVCHLLAAAGVEPSTPGHLRRVMIRTRVADGEPVASLTDLWRGAAWHEREVHEMFGLDFPGFDDGTGAGLRPLLLPDGFEGTPLRKSFVLAARASKAWPGEKEPGGGNAAPAGRASRRRLLPPGVPDSSWGPR